MFLKWLYNRNKDKFWEFIVQDFYGDIPNAVKEPSIEFLSNARNVLERFWSIQAYNIQRRAISDSKNAQIYHGFLLSIRTLLAVVSKGKVGTTDTSTTPEVEKPEDVMKKIEDFVKLGKAYKK